MSSPAGSGSDDRLRQVQEVTCTGEEEARRLLEATGWDVEEAIALHMAGAGDDETLPDDQPAAAVSSASTTAAGSGGAQPAASPSGSGGGGAGGDAEGAAAASQEEAPKSTWWSFVSRAVSDLSQAVMGIAPEDFEAWFASRYGQPAPPISKVSFGDTCKEAVSAGKLLLVWFHQEESPATAQFCREVLQNELFLEMLGQSFVLWAGDVSRFEPGQISRILGCSHYPTLIALQPLRSEFENLGAQFALEWPLGNFAQPLLRFSPHEPGEPLPADQVLAGLTGVSADHTDAARQREAAATRRAVQLAEERALREEQDREYEQALLADQLAAAASREEADAEVARVQREQEEAAAAEAQRRAEEDAARQEQEAAERAREEERLARRGAILAEPEPGPDDGPLAKLSLRLPSGDRLQRTFLADRAVGDVYDWAHACRASPAPEKFVLCTSFPVKVLTDRSATLQEAGLHPSAALLLKAVED